MPYTFMQGSCRRVALTGLSKTFDEPPTDGPLYKQQLIDKLTKQQQPYPEDPIGRQGLIPFKKNFIYL